MPSSIKGKVSTGRLPNFLIIGMAKAGTSSLYAYLRQHPQIYVSPVRAPNFWGLGEQPALHHGGPVDHLPIAAPTLRHYTALFDNAQDEIALGEGSSFFNFTLRAAQRIQHYLPNAKLLLLLRQPAERAYSQYLYARRMGWEPAPTFAAALYDEPRRKAEGWFPFLCYRESSLYATTLRAFYERFPRQQIYVALFEDFCRETIRLMGQIHQFLGVASDFIPDTSINQNPAHVGIAPWLRSPFNEQTRHIWPYIPGGLRHPLFRWLDRFAAKPPPLDSVLHKTLTLEFHADILETQRYIDRDLLHWTINDN